MVHLLFEFQCLPRCWSTPTPRGHGVRTLSQDVWFDEKVESLRGPRSVDSFRQHTTRGGHPESRRASVTGTTSGDDNGSRGRSRTSCRPTSKVSREVSEPVPISCSPPSVTQEVNDTFTFLSLFYFGDRCSRTLEYRPLKRGFRAPCFRRIPRVNCPSHPTRKECRNRKKRSHVKERKGDGTMSESVGNGCPYPIETLY